MSKMTIDEAIKQLKSLRDDREDFADLDDPEDVFVQDMNAIDIAIEHLRDLPRWIPCSEKMPEKSTPVLICAGGNRVTAYYDTVKKVFRLTEDESLYYIEDCVTHWMPLPEPPGREDENDAERVD